jgi:orotidine-5'-phosphate decarboxylase
MTTFADRLHNRIKSCNTVLVAGLDPRSDQIPQFIIAEAAHVSSSSEDFIYESLFRYYRRSLSLLAEGVPAVKPNIAFFEQYGLGGIRAFASLCSLARELGLLVVGDCKRGDIGATAEAYARAYLAPRSFNGRATNSFQVDALTVNPFLGFETLEPFIGCCEEAGAGVFILIRTSNPGSGDIQKLALRNSSDSTISSHIAEWVGQHSHRLKGRCGLSGLGAVVGAQHRQEAQHLRSLMPNSYFLIPGFGAQGASGDDAAAVIGVQQAGLINTSRSLFHEMYQGGASPSTVDEATWLRQFSEQLQNIKRQIARSLGARG